MSQNINIISQRFDSKSLFKYYSKDNLQYSGNELSHYTTINGLKGIIESNGFWLSDHRFLNDEEEFNNGRILAIGIIEKLINKIKYKKFIDVLNKVLEDLKNHDEVPNYLCSFSTKRDSLDLWKWYSINDIGISIIFENLNTQHFKMPPIFFTSKVFYDDNIKSKIILNIIRSFYKAFLKDNEDEVFDALTLSNLCCKELTNIIISKLIQFKNKEFESESELRMIISDDIRKENKFNLEYRVTNKIIPYFNNSKIYEECKIGKLPIKEIIISPSNKQEIIKRSIEVYLKNHDYENVVVSFSKIPFRG